MIIGHKRILEFLKKSINNQRLAHAYLFAGPAHLGKKTVALEFIKMLTGSEVGDSINPDVLIIQPETTEKEGVKKEGEIRINQARKIQHQMSLSPYQSDFKIGVIDQAERMTAAASNCLLKTLEEPKGRTILILITTDSHLLLPTIVSRCQIIKFLPVAEEEIKKRVKDQNIVRLANGRPGLAISYLENPELVQEQKEIISQLEKLLKAGLNERYRYVEEIVKDIPQARQIIQYWLFWFRDLILLKSNCPDLILYSKSNPYQDSYSLPKLRQIIQTIKKTSWLLANPSFNARLALEVLMLEL
jgi:DNA polymerase-3 subunit delta'